MTTSRVPLVVAALLSAFLLAQWIVVTLISYVLFAIDGGGQAVAFLDVFSWPNVSQTVLQVIAFGIGVFISLRFARPVRVGDGWRATVISGVIATLLGVAAILILGFVRALLAASNQGTYPLGYSLAPTIHAALPQDLGLIFASAIDPLVNWVVPVVLAAVLLKVWLGRSDATAVEATAPASNAETPASR